MKGYSFLHQPEIENENGLAGPQAGREKQLDSGGASIGSRPSYTEAQGGGCSRPSNGGGIRPSGRCPES